MRSSAKLAHSPRFAGLHLHEIVILANLAAAHLLFAVRGVPVHLSDILPSMAMFVPVIAMVTAVMTGVRLAISLLRGRARRYLAHISRRAWLLETARQVFATALLIHTYSYLKLVVPYLNPASYDAALWELDRALFFGLSPNVFFLSLFPPSVLSLLDFSYEGIYLTLLNIAIGAYLSSPSERVRRAFALGSSLLWLAGAWLYVVVPSIGPCYRYPDLWARSNLFEQSRAMQAALWRNYTLVLQMQSSPTPPPVNVAFGVAAFPSLHVGLALFLARWMRTAARPLAVFFELFAVIIFIGSLATGWHYMVDSLAGALLAILSFALAARLFHVHRWKRLRRAAGGSELFV